jgi:hypothetical protein
MMQEATEAHGGPAWIFALCIAAAPRRLTSRFLNFLLSPACGLPKEPQPAISPRDFKHEPFPLPLQNSILLAFSVPPSEPKHSLLDRLEPGFPQTFHKAALRRHSVSGPLWFFPFGPEFHFRRCHVVLGLWLSPDCLQPTSGTRSARYGRRFISLLDDSIPPRAPRHPIVVLGSALRFS